MRNEHLVLKYTHVYNIKHTGPGNLQKKRSKMGPIPKRRPSNAVYHFSRKTRRTDILIHGQHREIGAILLLRKNLLSCTRRIQVKQP